MERASTEESAGRAARTAVRPAQRTVGLVVAAGGALAVAVTAITLIVRRVGTAAVPLDDAYIHFQFARGFARLEPLVYVPSSAGPAPAGEAVAGATSLLWPLLLAPFTWLDTLAGGGAVWVITGAWALGFGALGLLAHEMFLSVDRLWEGASGRCLGSSRVRTLTSVAAACSTLAFGGHVWCAGSGMESLPLAWVLATTARRAADWLEGRPASTALLVVLAWCAPLLRPEGLLATTMVLGAFVFRRRWRRALLAALGAVGPTLLTWCWTGSTTTTTTAAKWLPLNPYDSASEVVSIVLSHVRLLFTNLLNGGPWSATVLPHGVAPVAWMSLPMLAWSGVFTGRTARALLLVVVGLGMLIPTTYETFLVNRLRYLWPFSAPWLLGTCLGAVWLSRGVVKLLRVDLPRAERLQALLTSASLALVVGGLASKLPRALTDLAEAAEAITDQQVALGRWAAAHLPPDAIIGINDAGAITYFSKRTTFDVIGLTTRDQAAPWLAGPGSRFEHFERLAPGRRPTHFIVYPDWLAVPDVLGRSLTSRTVSSTIVGAPTKSAFEADWSSLGTGARPIDLRFAGNSIADEVDVADLVSEAEHGYVLGDVERTENVLGRGASWVDGGRARRTRDRFRILVEPRGSLLMRVFTPEVTRAVIQGSSFAVSASLPESSWAVTEVGVRLPVTTRERQALVVEFSRPVTVFHYWSTAPAR